MKRITRSRALQLIRNTNGRLFNVKFKKRNKPDDESFVCRLNVHKGVTGKGMRYDPAEHGLTTVYVPSRDKGKDKGFRCIPHEGLKEITVEGQKYTID